MFKVIIGFLIGSCLLPSLLATPEEDVAKALQGPLKDFRFNKKLATPGPDDHLLVFEKPGTPEVRMVAWTEADSDQERFAAAPASPMVFNILNADGDVLETFQQSGFTLIMQLTPEPRIYVPSEPNAFLRVTAAAERLEPRMTVLGPQTMDLSCTFFNPLSEDLFFTSEDPPKNAVIKPGGSFTLTKKINFGRPSQPVVVPMEGMGIIQEVTLESRNPLSLEVWPQLAGSITLDLTNPSGSPFRGEGEIHLVTGDGQAPMPFRFPLALAPKERFKSLRVPLNYDGMLPFPIQVKVTQRSRTELGKEFVLVESDPIQFIQLPAFDPEGESDMPAAYEGRTQGNAHWNMTAKVPPEGAPVPEQGALVLLYSFKPGAVGIKVRPKDAISRAVVSTPSGYGLWVYGDDSKNFMTCGLRDASGRVFQPAPVRLDWTGWRYLSFNWPSGMQEPLEWDSVFELINADGEVNGAVYINNPTLLYELPELLAEVGVDIPQEPEIIDRRNEAPSAVPIYNLPSNQ